MGAEFWGGGAKERPVVGDVMALAAGVDQPRKVTTTVATADVNVHAAQNLVRNSGRMRQRGKGGASSSITLITGSSSRAPLS